MAALPNLNTSPRRSPRRPLRTIAATSSPRRNREVRNLWTPVTPVSPSPDEEVIQRRGARRASMPAKFTQDMMRSLLPDLTTLEESFDLDISGAESCDTPILSNRVQATRKRLVMSPLDLDQDIDDDPPKPVSPPVRKQRKLQRSASTSSLQTRLSSLSPEQLVQLIESFVENNPDYQEEIMDLIPAPDVNHLIENLDYFQRSVYKALPNSRWGSMRDAFCYRRVKTHLDNFRDSCINQGKALLENESFEANIEYVIAAWEQISKLPEWDNALHNKSKSNCYRMLAAQCKKSIKQCSLPRQKYLDIRTRIEKTVEIAEDLKPCIPLLEKKLQKLP